MKRGIWVLLGIAAVWAVALALWHSRCEPYTPSPPSTEVYARRARHGTPETRPPAIAELIRRKETESLCRILSEDKDPFYRSRAAQGLGKIGKAEVLPALGKALEDKSGLVHSSACWAIGHLGDPRGVELLRPQVLRPSHDARVQDATWALREIRTPEAEELLIARLGRSMSKVTLLAVIALGENGSGRAVEALTALRATLPETPNVGRELPDTVGELRHQLAIAVDRAVSKIKKRLGKKG